MEVIIQRRFLNFANSLQNNEMLITVANVGMNKPFSTFGCNCVIHEWYSNIMPSETLYIDTVREFFNRI